MNLTPHLKLLGLPVKDRVTGFKGVVVTISFDLYGCIQAVVNPGLDKDGKIGEPAWFDVNRLEATSSLPVMNLPAFLSEPADVKGPAEKPKFFKP